MNGPALRKVMRDDEGSDPPIAPIGTIDLSSKECRDRLFESHPICLRDYMILTSPMEEAISLEVSLAEQRAAGAAFVANPRFGKTTTIAYARKVIAETLPNRAFVPLVATDHSTSQPRHALRDLAWSLGIVLPKRSLDGQDLEVAVNKLWLLAAEAKSRHIVLAVDEAQRWGEGELAGLVAVTNALMHLHKIRCTCFFWGQRELLHRRTLLIQQGSTDVIGRFMPTINTFRGISNLAELHQLLQAYDEDAIFPEGSGWSYTRFFMPETFSRGLRLAAIAEALWKSFARAGSTAPDRLEIGMEWLTMAIEGILVASRELDHRTWQVPSSLIDEAVDGTGFSQVVGSVYCPGDDMEPAPTSARGKRR